MNEDVFPLTAVVGHQEAKKAIILALINPGLNLLLWGNEGVGKRTLILSARNFLPEIKSTGCDFNCDPKNKAMYCTNCAKGGWKENRIKAPFVIVPYHLREEEILGTEEQPEKSLIGRANRGVLVIRNMENHSPELLEKIFENARKRRINLGNFIYPAFVQIMATHTGNPGKTRENFALKVHVKEIEDIEERIEIVRRAGEFRKDPKKFMATYEKEEDKLRKRIEESREDVRRVAVPNKITEEVRKIVKEYGLKEDYRRWILAASTANAAYEERLAVSREDLEEVMPMIIPFNP